MVVKKKRSPGGPRAALLGIYRYLESVVVISVVFGGFQYGLDDTIRHAEAQDRQGIPQPPMKHHVTGIPNPFETKREHMIPPGIFEKQKILNLHRQSPLDHK